MRYTFDSAMGAATRCAAILAGLRDNRNYYVEDITNKLRRVQLALTGGVDPRVEADMDYLKVIVTMRMLGMSDSRLEKILTCSVEKKAVEHVSILPEVQKQCLTAINFKMKQQIGRAWNHLCVANDMAIAFLEDIVRGHSDKSKDAVYDEINRERVSEAQRTNAAVRIATLAVQMGKYASEDLLEGSDDLEDNPLPEDFGNEVSEAIDATSMVTMIDPP